MFDHIRVIHSSSIPPARNGIPVSREQGRPTGKREEGDWTDSGEGESGKSAFS